MSAPTLVRTAAQILADIEATAATAVAGIEPADQTADVAILRWEDPPPRSPRGNPGCSVPPSKYAPIAGQLRERPGQWALVYVGAKGKATWVANMIRCGQVRPFRAGDYEAVTRAVNGLTRAYARYIGEQG